MKDTIVILSARHKNEATIAIAREITKQGYTPKILNPNKLHPYISNRNGWDLIYDNYTGKPERLSTGKILAIIPRIAQNLDFNAFAVEHLNKNIGIYTPQTAEAIRCASNKMATLQACSNAGIKVPKTLYIKDKFNLDFIIEKLGLPLIFKTVTGSQGSGVSILNDRMSAQSVLQTMLKNGKPLIIQEVIGNKPKDIRAIVVGDTVVAAELRQSTKKHEFRSNLSLDGGVGSPIQLDAQTERFCVQASKAVGLDISGVDIMFDTDGSPVLIEANTNFGWKVAEITGINIAEKMVSYVIERAKNPQPKIGMPEHPTTILEQSTYLQQQFAKAKNQPIRYTDRNGANQTMKIETFGDMIRLIEKTVKLQ